MSRPATRWLSALVIAAALAGCAGGDDGAVTPATRQERPIALETCALASSIPARCGRYRVPEDPAKPAGRSISLDLAVIPARRQPSDGALFYLAGGPGGAATQAALFAQDVFWKVNERRDIVLVDQRGTGGSHPLSCGTGEQGGSAAAARARVDECLAGLDADPRLFTTAPAMDDIDAVRRALGYGRIDIYGGSYGATAAQIYLRRHADAVRSLILDSGSFVNVPLNERLAENGERALDQVLQRCAADAECQDAYPRTRAELAELLSSPPRSVRLPGGDRTQLDAYAIADTVQQMTLDDAAAAYIPRVVHAAAHGDLVPLAQERANRVAQTAGADALVMFWIIECSEPWARRDPAVVARRGIGSYLYRWAQTNARQFRIACSMVPRGVVPPGSADPPHSDVPTLLLAGGADPQDPVTNLPGWRRAFPNGRLVVAPGVGHGAIQHGCLRDLAARFIARADAHGLDTSCASRVVVDATPVE